MNTQALFQVQQLQKHYNDTFALKIPDLQIPPGKIFCLLGPTGAGKSTLLRLLAAMESVTDGEVLFNAKRHAPDQISLETQRRMAMVFQRPHLLTGTVRSNIEYPLRLRGWKQSDVANVNEIIERLGLTKLASQSAHTLSGGQTQLVGLARALVFEPEVLLLDEPTSNLDPAHVALVEDVIVEDHQKRGTTIIWATHNLFQTRRVAANVGLLLNGQLVEISPTETFFDSPSDPRTADFVQGKMIY